jgi:beta-lactamase class A
MPLGSPSRMRTDAGFATALAVLAALAAAPNAQGQKLVPVTAQYEIGRAAVEKLIAESGAEVSVAFRTLDNSQELLIKADDELPATSQWVEIPVMIELYAEVEARALRWGNHVLVHNSFRSVDGSEYHLDPAQDPDPEFYRSIGSLATLRELEERMMKQNSQLAANLLIEKLGIDRINARIGNLHAEGIELRHGFQDPAGKNPGLRNTASARGMMEVLWALANDQTVSAEASRQMVGVLANARTAASGPFAGARTSGTIDNQEEALIVYGAHSFALAVIVRGLKSALSAALISKISHELSAAN